ncbi:MAG: 4-hydroxy-tetrahydrodipicolinate synthase [Candidatus Euphemobacter frigidus]|nr:4-hydroxy-tetrahydrodipicolinate synthase [Candidatus Euphemobacter frigidus]MDP8274875.1 4-hydroxy-tetrahydrodipicolinate synthase [Candidatus Euphemobacter frigidus]
MFEGAMVAIITPFQNGDVDYDALERLIDLQIENSTDVIVPCGTTGESPTLSHEEHDRVVEFVVEKVDKRAKVIAGAGSNSTREALRLTEHAQAAGADGALVITPYYNKPTQRGLIEHFDLLARETDIPLVLYNVPGRTGVKLEPETIAELSSRENIVAVKEACGSVDQVNRILSLCDITVISGDDMLTLPMMAVGGRGVISVAANIVPREVSRLVHAALEGRWEEARKIHFQLYPLFQMMFIETNPIPVKTSLFLMKKIEEELRLPLCGLSKLHRAELERLLIDYGLI